MNCKCLPINFQRDIGVLRQHLFLKFGIKLTLLTTVLWPRDPKEFKIPVVTGVGSSLRCGDRSRKSVTGVFIVKTQK